MEEIIHLIKERDPRWKDIKSKHKKCSMKLYKAVYDMHDHWTEVFDKKKTKPVKTSAKKASIISSAPHELKPQENNKRVLAGYKFKPDGSVSSNSQQSVQAPLEVMIPLPTLPMPATRLRTQVESSTNVVQVTPFGN
jgi:hypothetical protein